MSKTGYQNLQWVRMRFKFSTVTQALKKTTQPNYSVSIPFWNSCISMTGANRCKLGTSKNRLHGNISCCPTSVDCQWYSCPHGGSTCQYTPTKQSICIYHSKTMQWDPESDPIIVSGTGKPVSLAGPI